MARLHEEELVCKCGSTKFYFVERSTQVMDVEPVFEDGMLEYACVAVESKEERGDETKQHFECATCGKRTSKRIRNQLLAVMEVGVF